MIDALSNFYIFLYHYFAVIAFAGDALICLFRPTEEDGAFEEKFTVEADMRSVDIKSYSPEYTAATQGPAQVVKERRWATENYYGSRALRCASELREHVTDKLSAHIGISCGKMTFAVMGGFLDRWVYLLSGQCLEELSSCIDDAKSQEIVVTPRMKDKMDRLYSYRHEKLECTIMPTKNAKWSAAPAKAPVPPHATSIRSLNLARVPSSRFLLSNGRSQNVTPSGKVIATISRGDGCTSPLTNIAKRFVAQSVLDAVDNGNYLSSMSELREVSTLFLKLDSYDSKVHEDPMSIQPFVLLVQHVLYETGGFLRQFLVDDKGCVTIAMWGVPSNSFPNNAVRAVKCGTLLLAQATVMGHACSMGITTGTVFCGSVGSPDRRDYVGIGHTVNLAARFMSKAHGRIFIDSATHGSLSASVQVGFHAEVPMKIKGYDAPVQAYSCNNVEMALDSLPDTLASVRFNGAKKYAALLGKRLTSAMTQQLMKLDDIDRMHLISSNRNEMKFQEFSTHTGSKKSGRLVRTQSIFEAKKSGKGAEKLSTWDVIRSKTTLPIGGVTCTIVEGAAGTGELSISYVIFVH